jgi:long-chain acyl-CoA synthetase
MSQNLAWSLRASAMARPAVPALRYGGDRMSFSELERSCARLARLLGERGVVPGDRVGVMLPNVPEFAIAYYGALMAGVVVVPMNVLLKRREVSFVLGDCGAELLLAWHEFAGPATQGAVDAGADAVVVEPEAFARLLDQVEPLAAPVERSGQDTAVILYTSGTTGKPKGAQLTHSNIARNARACIEELFNIGPGDVILGALPLFHAFGQVCGLNAAVAAGASLALVPRFDAASVLKTIERERVTVFQGVPTMYSALLAHPQRERFDVSSLRVCASGGAALPVEVLHAFEREFGCVVLEGYGLSETSPVASFNHPDGRRQPGSVGTPVEGVEMRVVDDLRRPVDAGEVGEIAIRGHNIMKGYWNQPYATAAAIDTEGWFYSGDLGRVDAEGRYYIVDRKKDMIIRGGYNVYPREIEEVLYEHPCVHEAAVIGIPHAELGEEVGAAVVLTPGAETSTEELREFVHDRVAAYKYPRHVWLLDELPKGPTGKILKRQIQAPAEVVL